MTTAVRISDQLVQEARLVSAVDNRSVTGQIEHWAKIGKCSEENPELTYELIRDILIGIEELEQGSVPNTSSGKLTCISYNQVHSEKKSEGFESRKNGFSTIKFVRSLKTQR